MNYQYGGSPQTYKGKWKKSSQRAEVRRALGSKLVEGAVWEAIAMAWLICWKEFVKYDADDEVKFI